MSTPRKRTAPIRRVMRSRLAITAALALFLAAAGGVAYAASGSPFIGQHGNINTCVPPRGGEVNVWKPGHKCSGGRVPLAFPAHAQNGAPGPQGATGPTGPTNPSAATVNGETVTKLLYQAPTPASGTSSFTLYTGDGLTILADCSNTGDASLVADGPVSANSALTVNGYHGRARQRGGTRTCERRTCVVLIRRQRRPRDHRRDRVPERASARHLCRLRVLRNGYFGLT
jgi:hypothetical protein